MQIKAEIRVEYSTPEQANITLHSLKPDDTDYVDSQIKGNIVKFKISSDSMRSILATVEDLLFCEMVVERMLTDME